MADEKRLIDANALFNELIKKQYSEQTMGIVASYYPQMRAIVANAPTVDAVEVVHGHWISKGYKIECSACGHRAFLGTHDPVLHTEEKNICKYCHNCGAKMDGGNEDG